MPSAESDVLNHEPLPPRASAREGGRGPRAGWGRGWRGALVAALLVLLAAGVCVRLGFWQLDRLEQRRARNAQTEAALALPTLDLDARLVREIAREPASFLNRRVRVVGSYQPGGELLLRGRASEGRPGVHLVAPLRLAGGDAVLLVNRGWVPAADAATLDPAPLALTGEQGIEGLLQLVPSPPEGGVPLAIDAPSGRVLTLRRLDLAALRGRVEGDLLPVYLQQLPDRAPAGSSPAPPFALSLPTLDDGPHLSYAVQWFGFATVFVIGFLVVLARQRIGGAD